MTGLACLKHAKSTHTFLLALNGLWVQVTISDGYVNSPFSTLLST